MCKQSETRNHGSDQVFITPVDCAVRYGDFASRNPAAILQVRHDETIAYELVEAGLQSQGIRFVAATYQNNHGVFLLAVRRQDFPRRCNKLFRDQVVLHASRIMPFLKGGKFRDPKIRES
ncbi:MAG: hypothetical protein FD174_3928 [Geobacteraceae bacterium]|nr:MAG: hypothetical protein FD174_3928 [Geobacteraceae bacterium]